MQLAMWTYDGPPHVGAMRVATSMKGLHYVLHAPQGDTYADLLFTMIERRDARPPVTYTTFEARDLGGDTADLFKSSVYAAYERFRPQAIIVGASCTAELLQDDPDGLARALDLPVPVIPLDLPSYQKKESWGASETFLALVRALADRGAAPPPREGRRLTCNLLGPTALGFRCRDDVTEITRLLAELGIDVVLTAPLGASPSDLVKIGSADFNVVLYPETGEAAARWLEKTFRQPAIRVSPIGYGATCEFVRAVAAISGFDADEYLARARSRMPWWSRSVDSNYLTGKRVFVFGDATHAIAMARTARDELGFEVVGLGCYNREFARELRAAAAAHGLQGLVSDDHLEVEAAIAEAQPELVLGTQMERHIAKRLRVPCAVISGPAHVHDYPARYSPVMGFEGANVLFDALTHPLVMGLEEHLLTMFREDFEFSDHAGASHLAVAGALHAASQSTAPAMPAPTPAHAGDIAPTPPGSTIIAWTPNAERELGKIPFFVRGKARRNTEKYATERGLVAIDVETLYDAKAHYAR
jgi:light-independent protochlorophyllide reductase subunit B